MEKTIGLMNTQCEIVDVVAIPNWFLPAGMI